MLVGAASSFAFVYLSPAAMAQTQDNDETQAETREAPNSDQIVVTGTKERGYGYRASEQSGAFFGDVEVLDTPLSVSSLTAEFLQDRQIRTIAEVAFNDPSVSSNPATSGFNDTLTIRVFPVSVHETD